MLPPKPQIQLNKGVTSEEEGQRFGMAQTKHRSKSYQNTAEWFEKGCALELPLQFDRSGGRVEEDFSFFP